MSLHAFSTLLWRQGILALQSILQHCNGWFASLVHLEWSNRVGDNLCRDHWFPQMFWVSDQLKIAYKLAPRLAQDSLQVGSKIGSKTEGD